jgi:hypothetical protein
MINRGRREIERGERTERLRRHINKKKEKKKEVKID